MADKTAGARGCPGLVRLTNKYRGGSVLETPEFASIVSWAPDGRSFVIHDAHAFARQVLPGVYKHKNYVSFVRQLNKYGFHKVRQRAGSANTPAGRVEG